METFKLWIQRFFSIITLAFFAWAIFAYLTVPRVASISGYYRVANSNTFSKLDVILALSAFLLVVGGYIFNHHSRKRCEGSPRATWVFLIAELIVYGIVMLAFIYHLQFRHSVDDAKVVFDWAIQYHPVNPWTDPSWINHYLYSNPQNLFLAAIYHIIIKIFGPTFFPVIVVFLVLHLSTAVILFLALRRLQLSTSTSLVSVQLFLFMPQVVLQAPIAYTDTLSLFFVSLTLLAFILAEHHKDSLKGLIAWTTLGSIMAFLAFLSKGTSLILIIAISLFLLLHRSSFKRLLFVIPILIFVLGNFGWKSFVNYTNIYPDNGYGQPNTHYIMMGLSFTPIPKNLSAKDAQKWEVGIYASGDQAYSWNLFYNKRLPKDQITKKQLALYFKRLNQLNPVELLQVLTNKISVVWGSGDLKTSFSFARGMKNPIRGRRFFSTGFWATTLYAVMTITQLMLYFGMMLSLLTRLKRPDAFALFSSIFLAGYFTFLLLWEANPRYSLAIFPVGILLCGRLLTRSRTSADTYDSPKTLS